MLISHLLKHFHSGIRNFAKINIKWIDSEKSLNKKPNFMDLNGILVPGGLEKEE